MKRFFMILAALLFAVSCYAADPAIVKAGFAHQAQTFSILLKYTTQNLNDSTGIAPFDIATHTCGTAYMPNDVEYPIMLRVQNLGTNPIKYVPYTANPTGAPLPLASDSTLVATDGSICVSGKVFEKVFYNNPNLFFNSIGNTSVVVEVWGRKGTE